MSTEVSDQIARLRNLDLEREKELRHLSVTRQKEIQRFENQKDEDAKREQERNARRAASDRAVENEFHSEKGGRLWLPVILGRQREIEDQLFRDKKLKRNPVIPPEHALFSAAYSRVLNEAKEQRWSILEYSPYSSFSKYETSETVAFYAHLAAVQEERAYKKLELSKQKDLAAQRLETFHAVVMAHRAAEVR